VLEETQGFLDHEVEIYSMAMETCFGDASDSLYIRQLFLLY